MDRISNRLAAWISICFLVIPGIGTLFFAKDSARHILQYERRDPASVMPWEGLGSLVDPIYLSVISDWLSDRLAFRQYFVAFKHTIDVRVLGHERIGEVHVGHHNWLFFDRSVVAFSNPDISNKALGLLDSFLKEAPNYRARALIIVAPDKLSIYPSQLSSKSKGVLEQDAGSRGRFQQFFKERDGHGVIDMWSRHRAEVQSTGMDTYWERDTHHNPHGQVLMAQSIVETLYPDAWWPDAVRPDPELGERRGDLARMGMISYPKMVFEQYLPPNGDRRIDKEALESFNGYATRYLVTTKGRPVVPGRTLLLHDSFGLEMRWIIAWFFEDLTMVNVNHAKLSSQEFYEVLDEYDTVIIEIVERNASSFFNKLLAHDTPAEHQDAQ